MLPEVALIVIVSVTAAALCFMQPPMPVNASANRRTASPLKRKVYLRLRVSSQKPKPNAAMLIGARRVPAPGRELAVAELEKLTTVLIADPAGVSVAGLKPQATPDGRPEQAKLTMPVKPLIGVTVTNAKTGFDSAAVPLDGLMESEKSGGGAVMAIVSAFDVEAAKVVLPPYSAVMEWLPAAKEAVVRVASPEALREPTPIEAPPSKNVTVPLGVTEPEAGETSAVKVRLVPMRADVAEAESAVAVPTSAGFTVTLTALEVLPLKLKSPAYTAVMLSDPRGSALAG
jgi:hypothetical protein